MSTDKHTRLPATTQDPSLMQRIDYLEQQWYTTQYFHAQYMQAHSNMPKKYQQYSNFLRMLRSLPLYDDYIALGHIEELCYDKNSREQLNPKWIQLYKATGYKPIILLNSTAQAELSHHLEDEVSKQLAHAANARMAQEATRGLPPTSARVVLALAQELVALEDRTLALERTQAAQQHAHDTLETRVDALIERHPPQGKLRLEDWLRRHGKPYLPRDVLRAFRAACRQIEAPELFRPEGTDYPSAYFSPYTLAAAYTKVTRQLTFFGSDSRAR